MSTEETPTGAPSASRGYATIVVGTQCCGHFRGKADLVVGYHCERRWPDGRVEIGVLMKRKWLADRKAFEYDPCLGWAKEHWVEWA